MGKIFRITGFNIAQAYLNDICIAISCGEYGTEMVLKISDPIVHSRELTTDCRILNFYVTTKIYLEISLIF